MAVGDIYQVTLKGRCKNQETVNVFHYRQDLSFAPGTGNPADDVGDEFEAQILGALAALSTVDMVYEEIIVDNLFNASQRVVKVINVPGTGLSGTGAMMANFDAVAFRMEHGDGAIRPGAKRFGGVPEGAAGDGIINSGAYITDADAAADALEAPLLIGVIIMDPVFRPVIVQRIREGVPGAYTYRLPLTQGEAVSALVTNVLVNLLISSQVSRKIGVGI